MTNFEKVGHFMKTFGQEVKTKSDLITEKISFFTGKRTIDWLRGTDLNRRPSGYEPDELPDCSTPRYLNSVF